MNVHRTVAPGPDERRCFPVDNADLARRHEALQTIMLEQRLDAVFVQGSNGTTGAGGYYHWLTGIPSGGSYPQTAVMARDGQITLIKHGAFGEEALYDEGAGPALAVRRFLGTPTFPAVDYTLGYDADLLVRELARLKAKRVGWISPVTSYHGFANAVIKAAEGVELIDITHAVDEVKAIKSAHEQGLMYEAARMQDACIEHLKTVIRPGLRDFEVMAEAQRFGEVMGSESGFFLGSSFPRGSMEMPVRYRAEQGRTIREGDIFFVIVENSGAGGMFTHLSRFFSLGKAPQELVDAVGEAVVAQDFTCSLLQPGNASDAIFADYNSYMVGKGHAPERRLHCHGQGYDLVERPLIRNDEDMIIREGMNIGVHPFIKTAGANATNCDNYLISSEGAVRLHATPREVIEL